VLFACLITDELITNKEPGILVSKCSRASLRGSSSLSRSCLNPKNLYLFSPDRVGQSNYQVFFYCLINPDTNNPSSTNKFKSYLKRALNSFSWGGVLEEPIFFRFSRELI
jgi:hypothetical protein